VEKRIAPLVVAVETTGDVTSLAVKLRELEARRAAIDDELRSVQPLPRAGACLSASMLERDDDTREQSIESRVRAEVVAVSVV